jgi:pyridine nucleotide-disulfide oxidoreductase family protein
VKRILLIGAGHAHLAVLRNLAKEPLYGARMTLVAPSEMQVYSGMLPGLVAGHYRLDQLRTDVTGLVARAYAEFAKGLVVALDPAARTVKLHDGTELSYDFLSLNVGSTVEAPPGGREHAVAVKPFEAFLARLSSERIARVAIAGAGAAGMELAMALRHRGASVTLYSEQPAMSPQLAQRSVASLRRMGVDFRPGMPVTTIEPGPVIVAGPSNQAFDLVLLATGPAPLAWLRESGLGTDARGFVLVDQSLRSVSHPEVFATGDCATLRDAPEPKAGVFSVRQGEALTENLRRMVTRDALKPYEPRTRALQLISCGARYAIAERGAWSAEGAWVWRWKDWIDRRWIRSLAG